MKSDPSIPILPCHARKKKKNQNTKSHTHIYTHLDTHLDKMKMEIKGMVFPHTKN